MRIKLPGTPLFDSNTPAGKMRVIVVEVLPDIAGTQAKQFAAIGVFLDQASKGRPPVQLTGLNASYGQVVAELLKVPSADDENEDETGLALFQVVRNIKTGEIVSCSPPLPISEWPFRVSEPNARLWRYGDYPKFKSLFEDGKLYFRRSDKFEDQKEATYTEANQRQTSKLSTPAFQTMKLGEPARIRDIQLTHRKRTFLSCWHKNQAENPIMWKCYTKTTDAIVISTMTPRLIAALGNACQAFDVQYIDENTPLPEMHSMALFAYKRRDEFAFEQEFRLVHALPPETVSYPDSEEDFARLLPADPRVFVDELRFHPAATAEFKARVRKDLEIAGLNFPVRDSEFQ
jgi:hypothetical protein